MRMLSLTTSLSSLTLTLDIISPNQQPQAWHERQPIGTVVLSSPLHLQLLYSRTNGLEFLQQLRAPHLLTAEAKNAFLITSQQFSSFVRNSKNGSSITSIASLFDTSMFGPTDSDSEWDSETSYSTSGSADGSDLEARSGNNVNVFSTLRSLQCLHIPFPLHHEKKAVATLLRSLTFPMAPITDDHDLADSTGPEARRSCPELQENRWSTDVWEYQLYVFPWEALCNMVKSRLALGYNDRIVDPEDSQATKAFASLGGSKRYKHHKSGIKVVAIEGLYGGKGVAVKQATHATEAVFEHLDDTEAEALMWLVEADRAGLVELRFLARDRRY
ncbi:hypothetical protein BDV98DRAFT_598692 [Pterulicium gracile]|uniref:Uncharacterized protein n=1 Tax=Pterulicium gracile TaxID=1884261 RepID=A0A5C3Q2Q6_9AGAR|nr:hypothetical protein BDV98DRAFT_598692 [Pterula gracilis]